jgi:hypothetical protein
MDHAGQGEEEPTARNSASLLGGSSVSVGFFAGRSFRLDDAAAALISLEVGGAEAISRLQN